MPETDEIPNAPPTMPASPLAIARELEPMIERVVSRVIEAVGERIDALERKSAERHKIVIDRLTEIERVQADHEKRLRALETTRIVLRTMRPPPKRRRGPSRAAKRR